MRSPWKDPLQEMRLFEWYCACGRVLRTNLSPAQEERGELAVHLCPRCLGVLHVRLVDPWTKFRFIDSSFVFSLHVPN